MGRIVTAEAGHYRTRWLGSREPFDGGGQHVIMDMRRTLLVDAFTDEPLSGNVAGVVPDAEGLTNEKMAQIAAELGASETAFVFDGEDGADERLRYFTPRTEVDLCGHATLATYGALFAENAITAGDRTVRTNVGDLAITVETDGTIWMRQNPPTVAVVSDGGENASSVDSLTADRLGDALGIDPAALQDIGADLPVAVASTGLPWLVVPVNFLQHLGQAEPDAAAIEAISTEYDVVGVYAFTFDTLETESTLHGRAFAPAIGVDEDPVTGTASGAVGGYLRAVDAFDGDFPEELRFEQGHFLDRPGYVRVRVGGTSGGDRGGNTPGENGVDGESGTGVLVGGETVVSMDAALRLPKGWDDDDESDEIIEA